MPPTISTERLLLNIVTENDADFMLALVNTEGWLQFIGDRKVHSKEDSVAYINRILNMPHIVYWVVTRKEDKMRVGIISFIKRDYLEHSDIGFAFLPHYEGKGYAFEAADKVLTTAVETEGYDTIFATTVPQNIKSIKLLTRLHFSFEKEMEIPEAKLHIYKYSV